MNLRRLQIIGIGLSLLPAAGWALESISDQDLSAETAGSGLTFTLTNPTGIGNASGASATNFYINPNSSQEPGVTAGASATFEVNGFQLVPIGEAGGAPANELALTLTEDAGADTAGAGVKLAATWNRMRILSNSLLLLSGDAPNSGGTTGTASTYTFGQTAFDGTGSFQLATSQGLLNTSAVDANRLLRLTLGPAAPSPQFAAYTTVPGYGQFYYDQGSGPQLVLDDIYFDAGFHPGVGGTIGACPATGTCGVTGNKFTPGSWAASPAGYAGLYFVTPQLDFNFTFDLNFQAAPSTLLQTSTAANSYQSSAQNLTVWGWTGDFSGSGGGSNSGAGLLIGGGGFWPSSSAPYNPDSPTGRLDGLNIAFHGNYDPSNFHWLIGRAGDYLDFGSWLTLPGAAWSLSAPNITLSVLQGGGGAGGLCWGASNYVGAGGSCGSYSKPIIPGTSLSVTGQYLDTNPPSGGSNSPSATALALAIRDLQLQAYSTSVVAYDDVNQNGTFSTITKPWALIYTLGQMDGNIYLYPGTGSASGLTADVLLMTQSFQNNANPLLGNSNFMIGEQCTAGSSCNIPTGTSWCTLSGSYGCIMAVGLTQANLLFAANQLHLNLNPASATYGSGIEMQTTDLRWQTQGLFAGGLVQNAAGTIAMAQPGHNTTAATAGENEVVASLIDINLEANNADLTFSPQLTGYNGPGGHPYTFMGLAGAFRFVSPGSPNNSTNVGGTAPAATKLDIQPTSTGCTTPSDLSCDGTYISLAEPFSTYTQPAPPPDVRFADIQGDIKILACTTAANCNGALTSPTPSQIFLMSSGDTNNSSGEPALRVAETLAIGTAAGGQPLSAIVKLDTAGTSAISGAISPTNSPNALGTIVMPAAQIYSSLTLRPQ